MLLSPACKVLFLCYNEAMDERYSRTALLLGEEGIERLKTLCVAVVGLGAVGGFAAEMLARAGTGTIRLIDFDRFETSNLNRQLLATTQTLGQLKTEAAAERIAAIAPDCRTEIRTLFFSKESADAALRFNRRVRAAEHPCLFVNGSRAENRRRRSAHRRFIPQ